MARTTYVPIGTYTLASNQQYVEFNPIPQTYSHLILICTAKDSGAGAVNVSIQVGNGSYDTGSNYGWTWAGGSGSGAASGRGANQSSFLTGAVGSSDAVIETIFRDYSNSAKYKTVTSRSSTAASAGGQSVSMWSGTWRSTSPISVLRVYPGGQTFATNSTFTLYGVL
jgi:hypothetical protein